MVTVMDCAGCGHSLALHASPTAYGWKQCYSWDVNEVPCLCRVEWEEDRCPECGHAARHGALGCVAVEGREEAGLVDWRSCGCAWAPTPEELAGW